MMQPSFHRRVLERFSRLIHDVNEKFAARWAAAAAAGTPINLTDDVSELILDIVLGSIFGTDLERLERQAGGNPFEVVAKEQNRDLKFAFRFRSLSKLVNELIERRRRLPEEHVDFLAMLMAARDRDGDAPMSNKEMIDEVMTLIVAGHETTAAALTWAWYLISQHPETATRIEAEADRVTPDRVTPDRVTPDRVASDSVAAGGVARPRHARPPNGGPRRRWPARPGRGGVAVVHAPGAEGDAASVPPRLALHPAQHRGR
jgi:cytochrome P450